jgi:lipoprotein-releasing system ATP-binding protein
MNKELKTPILEMKDVHQSYKQGGQVLHVLKGVDLEISKGEVIALIGPSGSGKSTLLQLAGLLEKPTKGNIYIEGQKCSKLSDGLRTALRKDYLGFVYQYHNLLSDFSALENVIIPQLIDLVPYRQAKEKATYLLERMGLSKRLNHRPSEMSGGEQQRVAIARALANTPKLLLADEPTGNLDPKTAEVVFAELLNIVKETGLSALIATHNFELADRMDRTIKLETGQLIDMRNQNNTITHNFY